MASKSTRRGLKWLLILAALAALGFAGYRMWEKSRESEPEYKTATISRGALIQAVTASGQLNPVVTVQVGSQVSGILQKIFVDFNSTVKSNQVVAQLDPATFQATVHQAEGDLANAQAGLELAQVNEGRANKLLADHLLAQADYDKTAADLHQAQAMVKVRQAALEQAQVDLPSATIRSPIDGVVISREVDVGQTVAASLNAPVLFKIANDLSKMQIDAMVAEADVGGIDVGQDVTFNVDAFPGRTFHGKVMQIRNSPQTVQIVVTYDTVVEVNNRDLKLKPGMTANVSIITAHKENSLRVPNGALRFRLPEAVGAKTKPATTTNAPASNGPVAVSVSTNRTAQTPGGRGGRTRGGTAGGPRSGAGHAERNSVKTIYIADKKDGKIEPKAVQIKIGITDGLFTEVTDGLKENDEVIIGINLPESESSSSATSNPFGGGRRSFR